MRLVSVLWLSACKEEARRTAKCAVETAGRRDDSSMGRCSKSLAFGETDLVMLRGRMENEDEQSGFEGRNGDRRSGSRAGPPNVTVNDLLFFSTITSSDTSEVRIV